MDDFIIKEAVPEDASAMLEYSKKSDPKQIICLLEQKGCLSQLK